tara:strand:+ start:1133 stop:1690 length:558 start_codon:yes stop_codon:yes gene_type:complete
MTKLCGPSMGPFLWKKTMKKENGGLRFNNNKPKLSLIPSISREIEALGWMVGAAKYGEHNWEKGMDWSIPFNCMGRHWESINSGEWIDSETGVPHLALIMCNASMLSYYYYHDVGTNDLPFRKEQVRKSDFDPELVEEIRKKYKDKACKDKPPVMPTPKIKGWSDKVIEKGPDKELLRYPPGSKL